HCVWLIPLVNLGVFLALGLVGSGIILVWPRHGRRLFTRGVCALALLPMVLVAFSRIYTLAWLVLMLGLAARLGPLLERHRRILGRAILVSLPAALAMVAISGISLWVGDRIQQVRESARPLPPPRSPNVLLIVLDTVAADHLGLQGYNRATSTTLGE